MSRCCRSLVIVAALAAAEPAAAHRLDELLQATRLAIGSSRADVTLDLMPGVEVAGAFIRTIDRNADGQIGDVEARAYVAEVHRNLALEVDGRAAQLTPESWEFATPPALMTGDAVIRIRLAALYPALSSGSHVLTFENSHRPDIGVFLANALVPAEARVSIVGQERDAVQTKLSVTVAVAGPQSRMRTALVTLAGVVVIAALAWLRRRRRLI